MCGGCVLVWCPLVPTAEKACSDPLCHTRRPPHPPIVPHGAAAEWWVGLQPNTEVLDQPPPPPLPLPLRFPSPLLPSPPLPLPFPSLLAMSAPHLYFTNFTSEMFNVNCHLLTSPAVVVVYPLMVTAAGEDVWSGHRDQGPNLQMTRKVEGVVHIILDDDHSKVRVVTEVCGRGPGLPCMVCCEVTVLCFLQTAQAAARHEICWSMAVRKYVFLGT